MMPVERLPAASWQTALGLGFVSAVFDNIPLTALALKQGGYDWGMLAYAVGFGGSMIWFGSSAGVALSNMYPEAKNVGPLAVPRLARRGRVRRSASSFMLAVVGWHPTPKRGDPPTRSAGRAAAVARADLTIIRISREETHGTDAMADADRVRSHDPRRDHERGSTARSPRWSASR